MFVGEVCGETSFVGRVGEVWADTNFEASIKSNCLNFLLLNIDFCPFSKPLHLFFIDFYQKAYFNTILYLST
jgi:hypothetical protein